MSLKRKRERINEHDQLDVSAAPETPSKKRRGRPPSASKSTSRSNGKSRLVFSTPIKQEKEKESNHNVSIGRNADRSARRKSARILVQQTIANEGSGDDSVEEDTLAQDIWDADADEDEGLSDGVENHSAADNGPPETPSKRGGKGSRRKRTPTPPQHLPPYERYFFENRGHTKTSNNTLSSLSLLSHDDYHEQRRAHIDPHASSYNFLHSLHSRSFPQWRFELSQSFNICLYGYGSK
ncbi:MAG: hypothetical protein Q9190_002133, partial [Brigantiaea leucoxantha]